MEKNALIQHGERILERMNASNDTSIFAEASEFLRVYAGERSMFYKNISGINPTQYYNHHVRNAAKGALSGFISYVRNDLHEGSVSIERKAQMDVVSDFLNQAQILLETSGIHPAAPAVIVGAALEEFLRNWIEDLDVSVSKNNISSYADELLKKNLITKQDMKDITSWAGLRNYAAHGEWNEVSDKKRVALMFDGVNLFMRKNS
jgi:hypothetical protein